MKRLAIVSTHPIQYNAPWFRLLSEEPNVELRAFYTWHAGDRLVVDSGFGRTIKWDIPLTEGYQWEFCPPSSNVQNRTYWNMNSPGLVSQIESWNADCVIVIGWNFRSHHKCMSHFKNKIPVWFRGDSTVLGAKQTFKSILRKMVLRQIYRNVDLALSVGQNNRKYFLQHGLKSNQILTVPHAIENERFALAEHEQAAERIRSELDYTNDETVILFAGKLTPCKALPVLFDAFKNASEKRDDLRLLIVGNGPLERQFKPLMDSDPKIQHLPFQNQTSMPSIYRVGDIFCLPSQSETWGLCLNESMACGRCVIASDRVGATRDLINQSTGYQFCSNNPDELANVLRTLPERCQLLKMGKSAQNFIDGWSYQRIVELIRDRLQSAD